MSTIILVAMKEEALCIQQRLPNADIRITGIGKVNAALGAERASLDGPKYIINIGTAGAIDPLLRLGDVVIGQRLIQHDYGQRHGRGFRLYRPGEVPIGAAEFDPGFDLDEELRKVISTHFSSRVSSYFTCLGGIASGDTFLADEKTSKDLNQATRSMCVEMEAAAQAQVLLNSGITYIAFKGISDLASQKSEEDFPIRMRIAMENAADAAQTVMETFL